MRSTAITLLQARENSPKATVAGAFGCQFSENCARGEIDELLHKKQVGRRAGSVKCRPVHDGRLSQVCRKRRVSFPSLAGSGSRYRTGGRVANVTTKRINASSRNTVSSTVSPGA